MVFIKLIFSRLIPFRFWMYGLYLIFLTGCSTYVGNFWTGFLTFIIGFPVWIVVGILLVYKELQLLRKELFEPMRASDEKSQGDIKVRSNSIINAVNLAMAALRKKQKKRL